MTWAGIVALVRLTHAFSKGGKAKVKNTFVPPALVPSSLSTVLQEEPLSAMQTLFHTVLGPDLARFSTVARARLYSPVVTI